MMRRILFLFILLAITRSATAQSFVDTPKVITSLSMDIVGDVDSVTELTLGVKVLEVGASLTVNGDSGSKVITIPDTSFVIQEENAWKFDEKGRLLKSINRQVSGRRNELEEANSTSYEYRRGRIDNVVNRKEGRVSDSAAYEYRGGSISMQELYDEKGRKTGRIQYFGNRNNLLFTISYKNEGLELKKMTKYWFEAGKVTSITHHNESQQLVLTQKVNVERDSAGNPHVMIFDYAKPDTCTGMNSYLLNDAGGHMEDVTQDERGNVLYISTAKFNDYNHMTEQVIFTDVKKVMTYSYEYDDHKNWTLKRTYRNGIPETFVRRTIMYRN